MIEAAIFANNNNHVFDGRSGWDSVDGFIRVGLGLGQRPKARDQHDEHQSAKKSFCSQFARVSTMHTSS
jgi:hypothetical protein